MEAKLCRLGQHKHKMRRFGKKLDRSRLAMFMPTGNSMTIRSSYLEWHSAAQTAAELAVKDSRT